MNEEYFLYMTLGEVITALVVIAALLIVSFFVGRTFCKRTSMVSHETQSQARNVESDKSVISRFNTAVICKVIFGGIGIVLIMAFLVGSLVVDAFSDATMSAETVLTGCAIGAGLLAIGVIFYFVEAASRKELQNRKSDSLAAKETLAKDEADRNQN